MDYLRLGVKTFCRSLLVFSLTWSLHAALIGHWTFEPGEELIDRTGHFPDLALKGNAAIFAGELNVNGTGLTGTGWAVTEGGDYVGSTISNKTLVSWITLQGLEHIADAGSAMTIDRLSGDLFDGIIFAEAQANRWMNGSSNGLRNQPFSPGFEETATGVMIQLAISYEDLGGGNVRITGYRNGVQIGQYDANAIATWAAADAEIFFGIRHGSIAGGPGALDALIEEARIYDHVLTQQEVQGLQPVKLVPADQFLITEFLASNQTGLQDEDGASEDWIELCNPLPTPINLGDWALTDDPANLVKWSFPEMELPAGACITVFASSKNRRMPGSPLHTNFRLEAAGEYLALVMTNGVVAQEFSPVFPPQLPDISYGLPVDTLVEPLLATNDLVHWKVPTDDTLEGLWYQPGFDDSAWGSVAGGIGYDTGGGEQVGDPLDLPGLTLWLDAADASTLITNGNSVTEWRDKSTTRSHVSQGDSARQPVVTSTGLNGHNLVTLDGVDDFLVGPAVLASGDDSFTVFAVWRPHRVAVQVVFEQAGAGAGRRAAMLQVNGRYGFNGQNNDAHGLAPITANDWHLSMMEISEQTLNNVRVFNNGEGFTGTINIDTQNTGVDGIRIGSKLVNNAELLDGDVAEIIVYDRVLSPAEHDALALYLESKYALTTRYPVNGAPGDAFRPFLQQDVETEMLNINASLYLRYPFDAPNAANLQFAQLGMRYDDGYVAYLNGVELVRRAAPEQITWDAAATLLHADAQALQPESLIESLTTGLLQPTGNVFAVQAMNRSAANPDLLLMSELAGLATDVIYTNAQVYFNAPTPGFPNGPGSAVPGPILSNVTESSPPLLPGTDLVIAARASASVHPLDRVTLHYRVMFGPEQTIPMVDDGVPPDILSGDGAYVATITGTAYRAGDMIRWRVEAVDDRGAFTRSPRMDEPESAAWYGTIATTNVNTTLPVLEWFVEDPAAARTDIGTSASVFFNGQFYDNILVRRRGLSTLGWAKNKFKFDFNPGDHFRYDQEQPRVEEFNLQSHFREIGPVSYMRENLGFAWLNEAGVDAPHTFHLHLRQNGTFYGLYSFVEQVDDTFLMRTGNDDDSVMYKALQNGTLAPNPTSATYRKATHKDEPWDDFQAFTDGLSGIGTNRNLYIFDHLDLAQVVNEMAAQTILPNHDRLIKNYYVYLDPGSLEWRRVPWDVEQSFAVGVKLTNDPWGNVLFGDEQHIQEPCCPQWFNYQHDAILDNPQTRAMYLRRLRSLMDQYLDASTGYFENLIMEHHDRILDDAILDNSVWGAGDIDTGVNGILTETLPTRRTALFADPLIPSMQETNLVIQINSLDFSPLSGNQNEEYIELINTNAVAVDLSGWSITGGVRQVFKPGTVLAANTSLYVTPDARAFRSRTNGPTGGQGLFVQGAYDGRLSSRGETIEILDENGVPIHELEYPGSTTPAQDDLRITELMYFPAGDGEAEFVELQNTGSTPLDLTGVRLSGGVSFNFTNSLITVLAPNEYVLVVRDRLVMENLHGPNVGLRIGGEFDASRLENNGERIKLEDAQNNTIQEFRYRSDGDWPACAAGAGPSIEVLSLTYDAVEQGANWQASVELNGTPGTSGILNPDGDCDTLPDAWELMWFGDRRADSAVDADLDGLTNGEELITGTDPTSAASVLKGQAFRTPVGIEIRFPHVNGVSYALWSSPDLVVWSLVRAGGFVLEGDTGVWAILTASETTTYYRIVAE
jgi:hypothetical protein